MASFLIWRIGDFVGSRQILNLPILYFTILSLYAEALAIAKFKLHQCILMTDSPNLMLTKVSTIWYGNYNFGYVFSCVGNISKFAQYLCCSSLTNRKNSTHEMGMCNMRLYHGCNILTNQIAV